MKKNKHIRIIFFLVFLLMTATACRMQQFQKGNPNHTSDIIETEDSLDENVIFDESLKDNDTSIETRRSEVSAVQTKQENRNEQHQNLKNLLDLEWTVGKLINDNGSVSESSYYGITNAIPVEKNILLQYAGTATDIDDNPFVVYLCEYKEASNDEYIFIKRTNISDGEIIKTDNTTQYIRFVFGRKRSSKVTLSTKDVENYFDFNGSNTLDATLFSGYSQDVPSNEGVRNAYKTLKQFAEIQWTPLADIPGPNGKTAFKAGITYTGFPYSSVKETESFVGFDVSIETFMTAVHNPHSVLYTENLHSKHSMSGMNKVYNGNNCGAYYGVTCSSLAFYALGLDTRWGTWELPRLIEEGLFEYVPKNSATEIQLMDCIWEPGHIAVVSEIIRDNNDMPISISVIEAAAPKVREICYTLDEFNNRVASKNGTLIRCISVNKCESYTQCPFVTLANESAITYTYNDDICTIKGNKALFLQGDYIGINYNAGNYSKMIVRKNGKDIVTITLNKDNYLVDLSDKNLTFGTYSAVLSDGKKESAATEFEIVKISPDYTIDGNNITIRFANKYAVPLYVDFCNTRGGTLARYFFSDEEKRTGTCSFDYIKTYVNNKAGETKPSYICVRLIYKASYGRIASNISFIPLQNTNTLDSDVSLELQD